MKSILRNTSPRRNLFITFLPLLIFSGCMLVMLCRFGVNTPFFDQWDFVPSIQKMEAGKLGIHDLWQQHNEHRIPFPLAALLITAHLTNWHTGAEILLSFVLAIACATLIILLIVRTVKSAHLRFILSFLAMAWFFSLNQWENWLWGWQIEWFMNILGVVLSVFFITRLGESSRRRGVLLIGAITSAILASYSLGSGIFVWIVGAVLLMLLSAGRKVFAIWSGAAILTTLAYYHNYVKPPYHPVLTLFIDKPVDFAKFILSMLGRPVINEESGAIVVGLIFVTLTVVALYNVWLQRNKILAFVPWLGFMLYATGAIITTALSRLGFGVGYGLTDRYTAFSILYVIGILGLFFVIIDNSKKVKNSQSPHVLSAAVLIAVFIPLLASSYYEGFNGFKARSEQLKNIKECTHRTIVTDSCLGQAYHSPALARERLQFLKKEHLGGY